MLESSLVRTSKLVLLLGLFAWSAVGRADVAPADECTMPGQPCTNTDSSRGDVGKKGICMSDTCTRWGVGDGGPGPVEYECSRCVATDASDAGSGGGGQDDGGCSVRGAAAGGTLALIGVALALLAGRLRRRP